MKVKLTALFLFLYLLAAGCDINDSDSDAEKFESWTRLSGVAGARTYGGDITSDSAGNCYIVGYTNGDLDGETSIGNYDAYIKKYSRKGEILWTKLMGVSGSFTNALGIESDSAGNLYITGSTGGNLEGQTLTGIGYSDMFVAKLSSSGEKKWIHMLGVADAYTNGRDIIIDSEGNIYIAGETQGDLDGQILSGYQDMSITKYSSVGEKQWTRLLGLSQGSIFTHSVSIDSAGNCYITGEVRGGALLDGLPLTGSQDMFITKYSSNGVRLWTRLLGAPGVYTWGSGINTDPDGYCYISGYTKGNLDDQSLTGNQDMFVTKYSSSGERMWIRFLGSLNVNTFGNGIIIDSSGNSYITGEAQGDMDGQMITGTSDMFVSKYSSSGEKQWTRLLGVAGEDTYGNSISIDSAGICYVVGYTYGDLDGQTLSGEPDTFITTFTGN